MFEYELSVNIKVENKEAIKNLLITVESINASSLAENAIELLSVSELKSIRRLNTSNEKQNYVTKNYEEDSWLSPLMVKTNNV